MTRRAPVLHALSWAVCLLGFCFFLPGGFLMLLSSWFEDAAVEKEQTLHDLDLFPTLEHR